MQTLRKKNSPCKFKKEPTRFLGEGVSFKAKLIGILEVSEARGDRMCQAALADLKMAIRAAGEHKQRIAVQVSIDGLRLRDEKTGECLYHHPVHKISFIAQDMSDSRAFGYIFGSPDTGHRFFGIKTDKAANQVVIAMRDLFQVVFELKKKEIELTKQNIEQSAKFHISGIFVEPAPDTKGAAGAESCMQRIRTASLDADKISSNIGGCSLSSEKKNETQTGVIADLLDLQFELNSLQQGIHQLDKITPDNPRPSSEDPFESDPFGDSFANMKVASSVQPILPPPPSSSKRGHLERQSTIPATTSSLTSSPATRPVLASKTPPPQEPVKWMETEGEKRFSDGEVASLTNNGSVDEDRDNGSTGMCASQRRSPQIDVFTELDPLGTGSSKPYIDKKDFFQHLKNPPKKVLKDLVTTSSGDTFPTNFDITLDPLDPIRARNEVSRKSTESFEDGDFANFESFDNENEVLPESTISSSPQPQQQPQPQPQPQQQQQQQQPPQQQQHQTVSKKSDSPQPLSSGRSCRKTIHHQPLSVSLPPEDSYHKSPIVKGNMLVSNTSFLARMEKECGDSIHSLMRLPSPKKYQSMKRRDHEVDLTIGIRRRESIDKPFPVDFSKNTETASPEANSRLSTSSAELDIVPEPPPRGTAGIMINPPPLPPKKQAIRGGSVKPPPRPPYTDSQLHYDFIEREETNPSPTRRGNTQSSAHLDSKSRFDDNFSPTTTTSRTNEAARGEDNASFGTASRYDSMIPTTLSTLFRNPYMGNVTADTKRALNNSVTSSSFATTTKPSLDITLSQLTSSNLAEFATSLDMSVSELTNLTLQQLTECLARLSAKEANGTSVSQCRSASPISNSGKIAEASVVTGEPLFKADFDSEVNQSQPIQQSQQNPTYDRYAVFRELVEMDQLKEETAASETAETGGSLLHVESPDDHKDSSRSTYSIDEANESKERSVTVDVSDMLSTREASVDLPSLNRSSSPRQETRLNGDSKDRSPKTAEEETSADADEETPGISKLSRNLQSSTPISHEIKRHSFERLEADRAQDDDEDVDENEESDPTSIIRDRSSSEEKPTSLAIASSPLDDQMPKNLAEQDLLKLFTESSSEAISPRKTTSVHEDDPRIASKDIFEEIRMLNNMGSRMATQDNKISTKSQNKLQPSSRQEEKTRPFEKFEIETPPLRGVSQQPKARVTVEKIRRIEDRRDYEDDEVEEDEEMDAISIAGERSSSEEKPTSLPFTSPIEQQQPPKSLAEQDLMKLFSESSTEIASPRKSATLRDDNVRTATDIFEEIRMLNNAEIQSSMNNRQIKDTTRATSTSGFEDVFCPFVEAKTESKDGQESLADSVKDEGNWAKFENTGVFNSDKSSYDDPASVGGTSPWSPDEKDFQVEGGRKASGKQQQQQQQQQQQHRLPSGESDNEWKDEEESEESNGRRQFRDEGGFWYGRHPRVEMGEESPYYDESVERVDKDWHFCERERGGRKFRGGGPWSGKPGNVHRVRDPSPWHEESSPGGRWPRDDEEQPQQPQPPPAHAPHNLHRGRYPMSRKQISGSYKDDPEESSKGYWKCRTKQRPWNGDREGFRNPSQQQSVQQGGHYAAEPIFYEDDRTKKRMMLWSGEREEDCDRDRFSSQESMGYEDEERWSRREHERRRGDKWEEEMSGPGGRFWPRRGPPGDSTDLRGDYVGERPAVVPPSQASHEIYRKQHYCRADMRERSTGHDPYSSGMVSGGSAGGWLEDEYSLPDRGENSPRYLTRKRHWPKRPNSANDERNMGEPVYADPRIKYGMSRSECSDNDSELYHRPYRSRSRESYWGSDQEFESWTGSGSERLYWSEGPDAKSETLHRRRMNRHKSNRPIPQQKQSSPFEDDFAETLDRGESSFESFVMDASPRPMIGSGAETKQPTTPRNAKEHQRKADPRGARYAKQSSTGSVTRGSGYFENETNPGESSPGERPRLHSDAKTTPETFASELSGKTAPTTTTGGESFAPDDTANRDSFFNGEQQASTFDDDAFAFESEMADSVPETTNAAAGSHKNSRQIKYGNNKIKGDHDIKKSESVNIFVRESDPFDDDDFFK